MVRLISAFVLPTNTWIGSKRHKSKAVPLGWWLNQNSFRIFWVFSVATLDWDKSQQSELDARLRQRMLLELNAVGYLFEPFWPFLTRSHIVTLFVDRSLQQHYIFVYNLCHCFKNCFSITKPHESFFKKPSTASAWSPLGGKSFRLLAASDRRTGLTGWYSRCLKVA